MQDNGRNGCSLTRSCRACRGGGCAPWIPSSLDPATTCNGALLSRLLLYLNVRRALARAVLRLRRGGRRLTPRPAVCLLQRRAGGARERRIVERRRQRCCSTQCSLACTLCARLHRTSAGEQHQAGVHAHFRRRTQGGVAASSHTCRDCRNDREYTYFGKAY